jgi:hypothetical protein
MPSSSCCCCSNALFLLLLLLCCCVLASEHWAALSQRPALLKERCCCVHDIAQCRVGTHGTLIPLKPRRPSFDCPDLRPAFKDWRQPAHTRALYPVLTALRSAQ